MADKRKTIYNIERCISHVPDACRDSSKYGTWDTMVCVEELLPDALELLKEQETIIRCKDCKYGLYTGTEYLCDRHSGHVNRFGEDQYYKEWHDGNWFCADGERR